MEVTNEMVENVMDTYQADNETHVKEVIQLTQDDKINKQGYEYIRKLIGCRSNRLG